jgi:NAD+ synthase (glutamine-hydrolysing)
MESILRLMCAVNRVNPTDPAFCCDSMESLLEAQASKAPDIVVFPAPALCSPSLESLFSSASLLDAVDATLDRLCMLSAKYGCFLVAGLPVADKGGTAFAAAVLHAGKVVGLVADPNPPTGLKKAQPHRFLPVDTVFSCGGFRFVVSPGDPAGLPLRVSEMSHKDFDLIVVPSYAGATAGSIDLALDAVRITSQTVGCAVAVSNGGVGDTSFPDVYRGYAAVYECGTLLAEARDDDGEFCIVSDLDSDIIASQRTPSNDSPVMYSGSCHQDKRGLFRSVGKTPYLPDHPVKRDAWLDDLFTLQVRSLATRMQNARLHRAIVGVSGGLDSSLALLVGAAALDRLDLPRSSLIGVTMPGFGTSDRTYFNALGLMEALGIEMRDISIAAAVTQTFEDIGHNPAVRDVTYENAQARARSAILFNLANQQGAIVIGTGDLSEAALGFCTFGGDHLAGYNVNICIPKTVIRLLVGRIAQRDFIPGTSDFLRDILETPISPELLPAAERGDIGHKTEDILGPYELHDFFLYYLVRYKFRPAKLYYYACVAFSGAYDPAFILEKLKLFIRRFVLNQYKRSCAPDAARLTEVCLNSGVYRFPSDLSSDFMLSELQSITF